MRPDNEKREAAINEFAAEVKRITALNAVTFAKIAKALLELQTLGVISLAQDDAKKVAGIQRLGHDQLQEAAVTFGTLKIGDATKGANRPVVGKLLEEAKGKILKLAGIESAAEQQPE